MNERGERILFIRFPWNAEQCERALDEAMVLVVIVHVYCMDGPGSRHHRAIQHPDFIRHAVNENRRKTGGNVCRGKELTSLLHNAVGL